MRLVRLAIVSILALAALPVGLAAAQYPQPLGVCTVAPNSPDVQPNSVATFTVSTSTANGAPAPNVSGTVRLGAGSSGTVLTPTFTTGSNGRAEIRVQVGASGQVSLDVSCGAINTSGVVRVASPTVLPKPPDTGSGTTSTEASMLLFGLAALGLAAAAGTGTLAVARRRR